MCYEIVFIQNIIIYTNNHVIYVGQTDSKDTVFIQIVDDDDAFHLVLFSFQSFVNFWLFMIKRFNVGPHYISMSSTVFYYLA